MMLLTLEQIIEVLSTMPIPDNDFNFHEFAKSHGWKSASGATKCCFIIPKADFVIKFCQVSRKHNECEQEAKAYESAKKYRIEKVLLETKFVYENPNGTRFYMQPKITEVQGSRDRKRYTKNRKISRTVSTKTLEKVLNSMYCSGINSEWMATVISLYGKKFCKSLEAWSRENRVNDLHYENIGYFKGKPVILDYSGYCNF